jgi:cation:H+ antiporter
MADWIPTALIFVASSVVLIKASSLAVKYILEVAWTVRVTEFLASFVLAGLVSILPEFFVGVNSALEGVPEIGIGTLVGNNIVDLTLVIGIIVILGKEIPISGTHRLATFPFLAAIGLPLILMVDGSLSTIDGLILVGACVSYLVWMISQNRLRESGHPIEWEKISLPLGKFFVMMILVYFASKFVVESSVDIAHIVGMPTIFAGLFLISIGAALPEFTFSVQAILSRHKSVGLADVLGNVAIDATLSIGVMALIRPFDVDLSIIGISTLIMGFAALMLTTFIDDGRKLTRQDGIALIGLYVVFVIVQLTLNAEALFSAH